MLLKPEAQKQSNKKAISSRRADDLLQLEVQANLT